MQKQCHGLTFHMMLHGLFGMNGLLDWLMPFTRESSCIFWLMQLRRLKKENRNESESAISYKVDDILFKMYDMLFLRINLSTCDVCIRFECWKITDQIHRQTVPATAFDTIFIFALTSYHASTSQTLKLIADLELFCFRS